VWCVTASFKSIIAPLFLKNQLGENMKYYSCATSSSNFGPFYLPFCFYDPPLGKKWFLLDLFDGWYLKRPYIVCKIRRALCILFLRFRKTVRSITPPGRSYRGGRRK